MERKIKFRGQSIMDGKWFYGDLINSDGFTTPLIRYLDDDGVEFLNEEVMGETVGQFTGLTVQNEEIYEDDIIELFGGYKRKVVFKSGTFIAIPLLWNSDGGIDISCFILYRQKIKAIIGNIHDNPEMLNTKTE